MKKIDMKTIKMVIIFMLGWSLSLCYCAEESEQTRQEIIEQAMIDFPHLVEYYDMMCDKYPHEYFHSFYDYVVCYLAKNDLDPNFGELICDAIDWVLKTIENEFLAKVDEADCDHTQDPLFIYIMKYKDTTEIGRVVKKCLEMPCENEETLLGKVIKLKKDLLFKNLLEFGVDVNSVVYKPSLLSIACNYKQDRIVEHLLLAGADVNTDDFPLFIAVDQSSAMLDANNSLITFEHCDKIVSLLLDAGADVNTPNDQGWYILPFAVSSRNRNVISMIVSVPGINLNKQFLFGGTALHRAVHYNSIDIVEMLLDAGIDTSIPNDERKTAYDLIYNDNISMKMMFAQEHMRRSMNSCCVIS
ncbi:hypothetical protein C0J27_00010 [Candidatus Chromulinivorax destructor]|uniref:Uncharacterized protein n=2 Tax=Candidatus Chromulinivorax destructor TaxID=2066483 RepID=A0A345ZA17_9BACT|nr:hypothetical protein C0J27_00010 [Candidatus Chromulinivorax destructor]